jgi:hypothetical protein
LPEGKEHWFHVGNHEPASPKRTDRKPKLAGKWIVKPWDMSHVNDLLRRIMKLKDEGVTSASIVYSRISRRIQPLQKRACFGFEYLGILDLSWFTANKIHQAKAVQRVSRVLLNAETVPYVPKLFHVKKTLQKR